MRHLTHKLLLLLLFLAGKGVLSQPISMVNNDTVYTNCCHHMSGSFSYDYYIGDRYDQYAVIYTYGNTLFLNVIQLNCHLTITSDNEQVYYRYLEISSPSIDTSFMVIGDTITIHMYKENTNNNPSSPYLSISWFCTNNYSSPCTASPYIYMINDPTTTEVDLHWTVLNDSPMIFDCGPIHQTVTGSSIHLSGLTPNTRYTARIRALADSNYTCCADSLSFYTDFLPLTGTPDFTDLSSSYVRCYYGTFYNPYQNIGKIDRGAQNIESRHTVHTDTTETDSLTNGQLRTVCPGTTASVRLGNWNCGSEAEAIDYKLHIDTNIYSLLLLHYAAVLENPNHSLTSRPRFRMEILDSVGHVIDSVCGMADFIANISLGWNIFNNRLWKDWTTVGFDLAPFHGQDVKLRFTTYDCDAGAHFGYAYFTAECIRKSVASEQCGNVTTNSVTAPDGFLYRWYLGSPSNTLSTEQTYTYSTSNNIYHCVLTSKENASCQVTMSAYAGSRYPNALADTLFSESPTCQDYTVYFVDRSTVVNDQGTTVENSCETSRWYFGDGTTSTLSSPRHTYLTPGDYTVTLVAGIATEHCLDTSYILITVPDSIYRTLTHDTVACDSLLLEETAWYSHDTTLSFWHYLPDGCDTLVTYNLTIHPSFHAETLADTFCYSSQYTWRGMSVGSDTITAPTEYHLTDSLLTVIGCDSIYYLDLLQLPPDHFTIDWKSDCTNKTYLLTTDTELPWIHWSSEPHDTCLDGHESDTPLLVSPHPYYRLPGLYLLHHIQFHHTDSRILPLRRNGCAARTADLQHDGIRRLQCQPRHRRTPMDCHPPP